MDTVEEMQNRMNLNVLIIDDSQKHGKTLARSLKQRGFHTYFAPNSLEGIPIFLDEQIDVVLLDVMLGQEDGLEVLQKLQQLNNRIPVIMITAYGTIPSAVNALKIGASDYIQKPIEIEKILQVIKNVCHLTQLGQENRDFRKKIIKQQSRIITRHPEMQETLERAARFALSDLPVLIYGESGTGKELLADYIHAQSGYAHKEMLKINCAAFPESLLDNELFGHEKGAYTGADALYKGIFERAHNNSLFLDEIGDMPLTTQVKILRVIQHHEMRRLGGKEKIRVNVRFIGATNKNLETLIDEKLLREDLYYRLNTGIFKIPPLRERKDDIPLLIEHFLNECSQKVKTLLSLTDAAKAVLLHYDWPGNVRELENSIHYACAITTRETIDIQDLPHTIKYRHEVMLPAAMPPQEKSRIEIALKNNKYNKQDAARELGISRTTLYRKMEKYGIVIKTSI